MTVIVLSDLCEVCRKKEGALFCDFPKATTWNAKPARNGFRRNVVTCDRKVCKDCAVHIAHEIDFCPDCVNDLEKKVQKML